jgi:hypothetical protein
MTHTKLLTGVVDPPVTPEFPTYDYYPVSPYQHDQLVVLTHHEYRRLQGSLTGGFVLSIAGSLAIGVIIGLLLQPDPTVVEKPVVVPSPVVVERNCIMFCGK